MFRFDNFCHGMPLPLEPPSLHHSLHLQGLDGNKTSNQTVNTPVQTMSDPRK